MTKKFQVLYLKWLWSSFRLISQYTTRYNRVENGEGTGNGSESVEKTKALFAKTSGRSSPTTLLRDCYKKKVT